MATNYHILEFPLKEEMTSEKVQSIDFLPYGTRTLKIKVTNPNRVTDVLVLRSNRLPGGFGESCFYSHEEEGTDFRVSWGGGHQKGACIKGKDIVRHIGSIKIDVPVEECVPLAADQEISYVYLNLTHTGETFEQPRTLLLTAWPEKERISPTVEPKYKLLIHLTPPQVNDPVKLVADDNRIFKFRGTQVPSYLSRWWSPKEVVYPPNIPPPPDLRLKVDRNDIDILISGNSDSIARVRDFVPGEISDKYRDWRAELYHLSDHFFVLRLWFFWLWKPDRGLLEKVIDSLASIIGEGVLNTDMSLEEFPDAERFDFVIDTQNRRGRHVGTDAHWREIWTSPFDNEIPEAWLGWWSLVVRAKRFSESSVDKVGYIRWLSGFEKVKKEIEARDKEKDEPHRASEEMRKDLPQERHPSPDIFAGPIPHLPILDNCQEPILRWISSDPRNG